MRNSLRWRPFLIARSWMLVALLCAMLSSTQVQAQVINFETTPGGGTPVDDTTLTTPYSAGGVSVTFGFDTDLNNVVDQNAWFERAGGFSGEPNSGFAGSSGIDTADTGLDLQLGDWFIRPQLSGSNFGKFIIQYTTALTITAASGEIWDIDGTENQPNPPLSEQYRVQAFDASNVLLGSIDSPSGTDAANPLDGQPWVFVFSGLSSGLDHIEVTFIGTKTSGIGLAFNNFYPTTVPEPAGAMLLMGIAGIFKRRRRNYSGSGASLPLP